MKSVIDNQHLRIYVTVARQLNMSRAAKELRLTPSAISHALKTLENELGDQLFIRTSRKIELSPLGREFLVEAEEILERMHLLRNRVHAPAASGPARLRIGATKTLCQFALPQTTLAFSEMYPETTVQIEPCSSRDAAHLLSEERLDLAIVSESAFAPQLEFIFLAEEELQFLMHPRHAWAHEKKLPRDIKKQHRFITAERGSELARMTDAFFRREGIKAHPFLEIASESLIKSFVSEDIGVSLLPRWMAAKELARNELVALPIASDMLRRRWGILRAAARAMSPMENVFVEKCRDTLATLMIAPSALCPGL